MAPRFKSLDEANAWIATKVKEYGGKNKFLSSPEYKEAYPAIRKLHKSVKTKHEQARRSEGAAAMEAVGVSYGDRVRYDAIGPFMTKETITGKVIKRRGLPYVRLDRPVDGKKEIRWHKGFRRTAKGRGKAKKDVGHGGLDEWFSGHGGAKGKGEDATWGDWVSISPVKRTLKLPDGKTKKIEPGDIVGPCGISKKPEWKEFTNNGKDPLKCMPRQKAYDMPKKERAEIARGKLKAERKDKDTGKKPTKTRTFKDKKADNANSWVEIAPDFLYRGEAEDMPTPDELAELLEAMHAEQELGGFEKIAPPQLRVTARHLKRAGWWAITPGQTGITMPPVNKGNLLNAIPGVDPSDAALYNGDGPADIMGVAMDEIDRQYQEAWGRPMTQEEAQAVFDFVTRPMFERVACRYLGDL